MRTAIFCAAFALFLLATQTNSPGGVVAYLDVPAIPGPGAPQKYPTSMQVLSFSWQFKTNEFEVSRYSDSNSINFENYGTDGNTLHNINVLFYKAVNEMHDPYVTYSFGDTIVSGFAFSSSGSGQQTERIQFAYQTTKVVYLKIPGQNGIGSAPGYSNLLPLDSVTFDSNGLTIDRDPDATSPALAAAVANATDLGTASLLFYNVPIGAGGPVDPPYDIVNLSDLTGSSYQTIAGSAGQTEQVTFAFSDFNDAPEPAMLSVLGTGIGALALRRPSRRGR